MLPELGPEPTDLVLSRWHGVGPMGGTDLDAVLRNLGVSTIVVVGVSLNIAIPNVVMDAVNAAYRVVVPRDAVAGIPAEYGAAIIANTLSLLATITTHRRSAAGMGQPAEGTHDRHRARSPRRISRDQAGRRRTPGAGPVCRRAAPPAGPDRLHQPGTRSWAAAAAARRKRLRAAWTATRCRKPRSRPAACSSMPGLGPSPDAAMDPHRLRTRRRHHGGTLHPSPTWAETTPCTAA